MNDDSKCFILDPRINSVQYSIAASPTLQGTNISFYQGIFKYDFPFPKVGYVSFLESMAYYILKGHLNLTKPSFVKVNPGKKKKIQGIAGFLDDSQISPSYSGATRNAVLFSATAVHSCREQHRKGGQKCCPVPKDHNAAERRSSMAISSDIGRWALKIW